MMTITTTIPTLLSEEDFLNQNPHVIVKIQYAPKNINVQRVIDIVNAKIEQQNGRVIHYYVLSLVYTTVFLILDSVASATTVLTSPNIPYTDKQKLIAQHVKRFTNQWKQKQNHRQPVLHVECNDPCIDNILNSYSDLQILSQWNHTLSVQKREHCKSEFILNEISKLGAVTHDHIKLESGRDVLHKLCGISSLMLLQKAPYTNNKYLSFQYMQLLSQLNVTSLEPLVKRAHVRIPELQTDQILDLDRLSTIVNNTLAQLRPTTEQYQQLERIIALMNNLCQMDDDLKSYRVHPFGSSGSDYFQRSSDVDIALLSSDPDIDLTQSVNRIRKLKTLLPDGFHDVEIHPATDICIITSMYEDTQVDICLDNYIQVGVTKFLQTYAQIDSRLRDLVILVKHWIKCHELNNKSHGNLPPFAYYILCIYYMQSIGLLPNLQELVHHEDVKPQHISGHDIRENDCRYLSDLDVLRTIWSPVNELENTTVAALLFGFFNFYTTFDLMHYTISIRCSKLIKREDVKDLTRLEGYTDSISIEDPFELDDIGKITRHERVYILNVTFDKSYEYLLAGEFEELFSMHNYEHHSKFEMHRSPDQLDDVECGQLLTDDRSLRSYVLSDSGKRIEIANAMCRNRTIHGDLVGVFDGHVVQQVDAKGQNIICNSGPSPLNLTAMLFSVDARFPDHMNINQKNPFNIIDIRYCSGLMLTKRLYPWKHKTLNMNALPLELLGCSLDVNAQTRAIYLSNYINNYPIAPRIKDTCADGCFYQVPFGPLSDTSVILSIGDEYMSILLPDDCENVSTDHSVLSKVVIQIKLTGTKTIDSMKVFSTTIASSQITVIDDIEEQQITDSNIRELVEAMEQLTGARNDHKLFELDAFGYPLRVSQSRLHASMLLNSIMHIISSDQFMTNEQYEHILIRQFQKTIQQTIQAQLLFLLIAENRTEYTALVKQVSTYGPASMSLVIPELDIEFSTARIDSERILRVSDDTVLVEHKDGTGVEVSVNSEVIISLKVDTRYVPFSVAIHHIRSRSE